MRVRTVTQVVLTSSRRASQLPRTPSLSSAPGGTSLGGKLREGADARGVCEYLSEIQTERMELPATPDQLTDVGERVAGWYSAEMRG
jgi:hypothetical protein